jgi:hypothetical protein
MCQEAVQSAAFNLMDVLLLRQENSEYRSYIEVVYGTLVEALGLRKEI